MNNMVQISLCCAIVFIFGDVFAETKQANKKTKLPQNKPPNIIFILTDDQRYDELGFVNPFLDTPNMDAMAKEGVHFKNAFVTTALCSPSRATILTGQYMNRHGVIDNNREIPDGTVYFPQYLQKSGYATSLIGKWHMGGHHDAPQPGFDHWVSFAGQGHYYPINNDGSPSMLNVNGKKVKQQGYITDELTDYAIDWLGSVEKEKPFFLYLSHKAVHAEFMPAKRHINQYQDKQVFLPASIEDSEENYQGKPKWVKDQRNSWHGVDYPYHSTLDIGKYKLQYHRALSAVDDSIGRIRSWLRDNNLQENTIVILMGDNGFMFGEHGLIDKRNAYEESMRVPLLVVGPMFQKNHTVHEVVANLDIAPTILDLAGVEAPNQFQGESFKSLASGAALTKPWRSEILYEYFWEYNFPQTPTTFALRTDRYKYIQYHGIWDTDELYDLMLDPKEMNNLVEDKKYQETLHNLRNRLFTLLENGDGKRVIPYGNKIGHILNRRSKEGSSESKFPAYWID